MLHKSALRALLVIGLIAPPVAAQLPFTVSLPSTYSVSATVGTATDTVTEPAGPTSPFVTRATQVGGALGHFRWQIEPGLPDPRAGVSLRGQLTLSVTTNNASATKPVSDLFVVLSPGAAVTVRFDASRELFLYGSSTQPLWEVDLGNDGVIDYSLGMGQLPVIERTIGPNPFTIRIRTGATLAEFGTMSLQYAIRVLPDDDVVLTPAMPNCGPTDWVVTPTFSNSGSDVLFTRSPNFFTSEFGVLGFQLAPWVLPTPLAISPTCLLLPSPDVVFSIDGQPAALTIPAALRPVQLWAQSVSLHSVQFNGISLGTAYRIDAP